MSAITATFRFGDRQQHVCRFEGGYFGVERYYVNGKLVLKLWSIGMRAARIFEAEGHRVEIRVAVNLRGAQGEAYVDGELVASDLFADFNARFGAAPASKPTGKKPAAKNLVYEIGLWVLLALLAMLLIDFFR